MCFCICTFCIHKHQNRRRPLTRLLRKLGIVSTFDAGVDLPPSPFPPLKKGFPGVKNKVLHGRGFIVLQQCSHFFRVEKHKKMKTVLSDNPSDINGPKKKKNKKSDKVATEGRGFQEYRLQYQKVVRVDAREACKCSCRPVRP